MGSNKRSNQSIRARSFNLPESNIDTDQIYPARFLTTTERSGLGRFCFYDWRYEPESDHYERFSKLEESGPRILVAGDNFGCGSSREHAVWALRDANFKAVISSSFADIFQSNAVKNGLLLITVEPGLLERLLKEPERTMAIDLMSHKLDIESVGEIPFSLDAFAAYCIANDTDAMQYLLGHMDRIEEFEASPR